MTTATSGERNFTERIKTPIFLEEVLAIEIMFQFRRETQPQHCKRLVFLKKRPIHFYITSPSVIRPEKQNQLSFFCHEINKLFTAGSNLDHSCIQAIGCCPFFIKTKHLEKGLIGHDEIFADLFSKKCPFWLIPDAAIIL